MAKTQGEVTYETINKLMAAGMTMAEAVRKFAADTGKKEGAVRGNYYNHRRKLEGTNAAPRPRGRRPRTLSVDDAIAGARQLLEQAMAAVDREVDIAKAELDSAQRRYDEAVAGIKDRKADIERRIKALT